MNCTVLVVGKVVFFVRLEVVDHSLNGVLIKRVDEVNDIRLGVPLASDFNLFYLVNRPVGNQLVR